MQPVGRDGILVVTPYNAQIRAIQGALAARGLTGFRVGTVDKFQGQEAPVVIYSMATSSADEAPRGLDFLYDRHRLNVATSRAKAMAIIVASPEPGPGVLPDTAPDDPGQRPVPGLGNRRAGALGGRGHGVEVDHLAGGQGELPGTGCRAG